MVGPIRVDGLYSGIDVTGIIEQLLSVQRYPITRYETRIQIADQKKVSLLQVNANLLALKGIADTLSRPSFFNRTEVTTSNSTVLTAAGSQITSLGAYTFSVRQLATAHRVLSAGFADTDTTAVTTGGGTVTLEMGGGHLERSTRLDMLGGGQGVDRGFLQITDRSGNVGLVDLEGAVTVTDVLHAVNNQTDVNVRAYVTGDRIVVEDLSGGAGSLTVANFGSDTTASDLGIAGTTAGSFLFGTDVNFIRGDTLHTALNDGVGIRRNADGVTDFTITRSDGTTFDIDLRSTDTTVTDILNRINNTVSGALAASLTGDGSAIRLVDGTGGAGLLSVTPAADSFAAADLGFGRYRGSNFYQETAEDTADGSTAAGGEASQSLVGRRVIGTINSTLRDLLNGGQTHTSASATTVGAAAASATTLTLSTVSGLSIGDRIRINDGVDFLARTVTDIEGSVITLDEQLGVGIGAGAGVHDLMGVDDGSVTATDRDGNSFTVDISSRIRTTTTGAASGATSLTLASADGFSVGNKVRIVGTGGVQYRTVTGVAGNVISFDEGLDFTVNNGESVFASHGSLGEILNTLNQEAAANNVLLQFDIDDQGNGIKVVDTSGGSGALSVSDASGTAAADLGILSSISAGVIDGKDLDVQYISPFTGLATLNSGKGVQSGKIRIIDADGTQFDVDLTSLSSNSVQDVLRNINGAASAAGSSVVARINNTGDGIMLLDGGGGTGLLQVQEVGSTRTARDLNLLGSADSDTSNMINGSFERRIEIDSGSTLEDVKAELNSAGLAITASIVSDGNPTNPFRLSVMSNNTGRAGRLVLDSDIGSLSFASASTAQDSVLLFGQPGSDPMLLSSATNTYTDVVGGMTLDLQSPSDSAVTVTVTRDTATIVEQAGNFADQYNSTIQLIRELTYFNSDTYERGILFADSTIRRIRSDLSSMITRPVAEIPGGSIRTLQELGFGFTDQGGLTFNSSDLQSALSTGFDEVVDLFTRQRRLLLDTPLDDLNGGLGLDTVQADDDIELRARDSFTRFRVNLSNASTIGSILTAINNATGNNGTIEATVSSDGFSILLTDSSTIRTDRTVDTPVVGFEQSQFQETGDADTMGVTDKTDLVGATITFLSGANTGESRTISDFDIATDTFTLSSDLPYALAGGELYKIERGIKVSGVSNSVAGDQLRLTGTGDLGKTTLKGGLLNLQNDPGVAFRVSERLDYITRTGDGLISTRTGSIDDSIEGLSDTIERIEERVTMMEERLVREFARLEIIIADSQSTMSRLQASMGALTSMMGGA
jgi:flagellar hook-associated protein 2